MKKHDKKIEFIKLTNYLRQLPDAKTTLTIMALTAITTGILSSMAFLHSFRIMMSTGVLVGLLFLCTPSFLDSLLTHWASFSFKKKISFRSCIYLSFFNMLIVSFLMLVASALSFGNFEVILNVLLFSYVLVFVIKLFALLLTQPFSIKKSSIIAFIHPLLGLFFILLASDASAISNIFAFPALSSLHILLKAFFAFAIIGGATLVFVSVLNAPMLKNFGVSTFKLANAFLMHWFEKTLDIEKELEPMSEKAKAFIGVIAFKNKEGKLNSVIVVPYLHPGPFGEVGGAKMARILSNKLDKVLGVKSIIMHGTATHDLNPLRTSDIMRIGDEIVKEVKNMKNFSNISEPVLIGEKPSMIGQKIGNSVFLASTFSPEPTEDIEFTIGLAAMNKLSKHYENTILCDAHNCHVPGHHTIFSGDPRMYKYLENVEKTGGVLVKKKNLKTKVGVGTINFDHSNEEGIGKAGVRAIVFQNSKNTTCYVVFDSNNIKAGLREKIIKRLKNYADFVEVMTTDSHCVNNIQGVDNPLGERISEEEIISISEKAVRKALEDMQECTASVKMIEVEDVRVLGAQKTAELVSTVNSIIAVGKIITPLIFLPSITIALLGMMLISF